MTQTVATSTLPTTSTVPGWQWARAFDPEGIYLDSATMGLPPRRALDALIDALDDWRVGRADADGYDEVVDAARSLYARFVGVDPSWVAVGHQASPLVGLVAASIPDDSVVLVPEREFTSVTFPFAAQSGRGVRIVETPLAQLVEDITDGVTHVALAAVQSSTGAVADLDAIATAADRAGADVLVDLTQAVGWLTVDASRFAWTVASAYKWLLSPRGTAFLTVRRDLVDSMVPIGAGWYAGDDRWSSVYGLPLRLAKDARKFDVSPGWHAWVGTERALAFLSEIGPAALQGHAIELANAFAEAADLTPTGSAIRSLTADAEVPGILAAAGIAAAERAGRLRLGFHVNNTVDEAVHAGTLLRGHVIE